MIIISFLSSIAGGITKGVEKIGNTAQYYKNYLSPTDEKVNEFFEAFTEGRLLMLKEWFSKKEWTQTAKMNMDMDLYTSWQADLKCLEWCPMEALNLLAKPFEKESNY